MKLALMMLACNLVSLAAVIGAAALAKAGIAGWGWFLFVALIAFNTPSTKTTINTTVTEDSLHCKQEES